MRARHAPSPATSGAASMVVKPLLLVAMLAVCWVLPRAARRWRLSA